MAWYRMSLVEHGRKKAPPHPARTMAIQATSLHLGTSVGQQTSAPVKRSSPHSEPDFGQVLDFARAGATDSIRVANDWGDFSYAAGTVFAGDLDSIGLGEWAEMKASYEAMLPRIGGQPFAPPVSNYDPRIESLRLAEVELRIENMERSGKFEEALDAYIGINGLKDELTQSDRDSLLAQLKTLAVGALLEGDWSVAYRGAVSRRLDLSLEGVGSFLRSDSEAPRFVAASAGLAEGDFNLLSFIWESRWEEGISGDSIMKRAELNVLRGSAILKRTEDSQSEGEVADSRSIEAMRRLRADALGS